MGEIMNLAQIVDGKVVNVAVVNPNDIPEHMVDWVVTTNAGPGWTYSNGQFSPPEPEPVPVPESISFAQLLIGLVTEQWITSAEGRAWRDRVALPAQVQALIASLPVEQQFAAETRAFAPSEVLRNDPLVVAMGAAAGKTEEEMDDFFRTYSQV